MLEYADDKGISRNKFRLVTVCNFRKLQVKIQFAELHCLKKKNKKIKKQVPSINRVIAQNSLSSKNHQSKPNSDMRDHYYSVNNFTVSIKIRSDLKSSHTYFEEDCAS